MTTFAQHLHYAIRCRESWAVFSPGRSWRYRLVRVWDPDRPRLASGTRDHNVRVAIWLAGWHIEIYEEVDNLS